MDAAVAPCVSIAPAPCMMQLVQNCTTAPSGTKSSCNHNCPAAVITAGDPDCSNAQCRGSVRLRAHNQWTTCHYASDGPLLPHTHWGNPHEPWWCTCRPCWHRCKTRTQAMCIVCEFHACVCVISLDHVRLNGGGVCPPSHLQERLRQSRIWPKPWRCNVLCSIAVTALTTEQCLVFSRASPAVVWHWDPWLCAPHNTNAVHCTALLAMTLA